MSSSLVLQGLKIYGFSRAVALVACVRIAQLGQEQESISLTLRLLLSQKHLLKESLTAVLEMIRAKLFKVRYM